MIGGTGAVIGTSEPHLQSLCDLQGGCLSWDFTGPENCYYHLVSTKAHCHFMDSCINIPTHHILWISFAVGNISKDNRTSGAWHPLNSEAGLGAGRKRLTAAMDVKQYMWSWIWVLTPKPQKPTRDWSPNPGTRWLSSGQVGPFTAL